MPKVLVFTYYWPPSGGPAVQRWLSLSSLLPQFGIEPIIITVDEKYASYVLMDETLSDRIPEGLQVHKTRSFEVLSLYQKLMGKDKLPTAGFANESKPGVLQKLMRWIRGNFFFPDPRKGWNRYALQQAREIIEREEVKAVITAGPPQSTHLIGEQLKEQYGLFWLCDFHDAWTNVWYYDELKKSSWARKVDLKMEKRVLTKADNIITVGNQVKSDFAQKLGSDDKIRIHSMGYDDELFEEAANIPSDEFVITYTGTMADNYEPLAFFKAIRELKDNQKNLNIKVRLVGLISDGITQIIKDLKLETLVTVTGYLPHKKAVAELKSSCLLLLVSPNTPQAKMIIPGKIYEYMATRIPILNLATQETETARMIEDCSAGQTFTRNDIDGIKNFIQSLYGVWKDNPQGIQLQTREYRQYSRKREAEELANLLQQKIN